MHRHRKRKKCNFSQRKMTHADTYDEPHNIGDFDISSSSSETLYNWKEFDDFEYSARRRAILNFLLMDQNGLSPGIHNSTQFFGFGSTYKQNSPLCFETKQNLDLPESSESSSTISDDDMHHNEFLSTTERVRSQESVTESEVVELYRNSNSLHSSLETEREFVNLPKKDMEACLSEVLVHLLGSNSHISEIVRNRVKCQHDERFRKPRTKEIVKVENTQPEISRSRSSCSTLSYTTAVCEIPSPKRNRDDAEIKYLVHTVNELKWKMEILYVIVLVCVLLMVLYLILLVLNIKCKD